MMERNELPVLYTVLPKDPAAHLFEVTCTVQNPDPSGQDFSLPSWIPGSYLMREFARHVVHLEAMADGRPVKTTKLNKHTWRSEPCTAPLTLRYEIYAWDFSVRTAHLDQTHGFFNGTSLFLKPRGREAAPCLVELLPPRGDVRGEWRVATTLPAQQVDETGFGHYRAANYEELIDHPVEMGDFTLGTFEVDGIPHEIAITGRHRADLERICRDLEIICSHHVALFGELPAMERYLFLLTVTGEGYGGLEHRSSTALICSRHDLPRPGDDRISEGYRAFLGLCSHEYFHLWNVKRIRPAAFSGCSLEEEAYTRQLWAFEGITSYYDDLALRRSGLLSVESYLELLGQTITRVWRGAGRFRQSVAESSFDAWIKFYRQDENSPNTIVSYYAKGALIALALDLTIRLQSDGRRSLDDLMRTLWTKYGKTGKGVPEGAIEREAERIADTDLRSFFSRHLYGTEDPPLESLLARFGVAFHLRPADSDSDKGGRPATRQRPRTVLGARFRDQRGMPQITTVFEGGAAQRAGLAAGDLLCAIDHQRVTPDNLERLLEHYFPGERITVHAFRYDELMCFDVTLQEAPADTCFLALLDSDPVAVERRLAWLGAHDTPSRKP